MMMGATQIEREEQCRGGEGSSNPNSGQGLT